MKIHKLCLFLVVFVVFSASIFWIYSHLTANSPVSELYELESPQYRDIKQVVVVSGTLEVKNRVKVSSHITGNIKALHVEENDLVEKGQSLADIETSLGETELAEAQANYETSLEHLKFCEKEYKRYQEQFDHQLISLATLSEAEGKYLDALGKQRTSIAQLAKKQRELIQCQIIAPVSGIVISVAKSRGEKVIVDDTSNLLFQLAPDILQMEAELIVDERDVVRIKKGQKVQVQVDAYPNRFFQGVVENISFSPKEDKEGKKLYYAKVGINNSAKLLRPGMHLNAYVDIASEKNAFSITSRAFLIKQDLIQPIAEILDFTIRPYDKTPSAEDPTHEEMFVWKIDTKGKSFIETPVGIGVHDHIFYQITYGLEKDDAVLVNILEDDEMSKWYEKRFKKTF